MNAEESKDIVKRAEELSSPYEAIEIPREDAVRIVRHLVEVNGKMREDLVCGFPNALGMSVGDCDKTYERKRETNNWIDYQEDWDTIPDYARNIDLQEEIELQIWGDNLRKAIEFVGGFILREVFTLNWIDEGIGFDGETGTMSEEDVIGILKDAIIKAGL